MRSASRCREHCPQGPIMRSHLFAGSLVLLLSSAVPCSGAETLTVVVNEGAEAQGSATEIAVRYQEFSKRISGALKRPVTVVATTRLPVLQERLSEGRADLIWLRPANFAADAMASRGYTLVASAQGQFYAAFIVAK